jgi:LysM repeat protein
VKNLALTSLLLLLAIQSHPVFTQSLTGSRTSMDKQSQEAISYGYAFIETSQSMTGFINSGQLIRVSENRYLDLHDVSYPYARPGVKLFLDRLSGQYNAACGEKLTVTSLARPIEKQPANAAANSVHPTGMAVDLRLPSKRSCRSWLENTLLSLEAADVLEATRERNPPHYHVAVFTQKYESYVAALSQKSQEYIVRKGDTLSQISARTGTSVSQLRSLNGITGDLISIGQKLQIPSSIGPINSVQDTAQNTKTTQLAYRVRRGDTLWRIANSHGTSVNRLKRENRLSDDQLRVGQVLQITR